MADRGNERRSTSDEHILRELREQILFPEEREREVSEGDGLSGEAVISLRLVMN